MVVLAPIPRYGVVHISSTRSARVVHALEELGLPYTIKTPERPATPEHLSIHPLGFVPVLEVYDGPADSPSYSMFESGAIVQYLLDVHAKPIDPNAPEEEALGGTTALLPPSGDKQALALYLKWFWFAETEIMDPIAWYFRNTKAYPEPRRMPQVAELSKGRVAAGLAAVEKELKGKLFITGDRFTGADILMGGAANAAQFLELTPKEDFPNLAAYVARLADRPAFRRAYPRHLREGDTPIE